MTLLPFTKKQGFRRSHETSPWEDLRTIYETRTQKDLRRSHDTRPQRASEEPQEEP
jgi:hypothetical protein